MKLLKLAVAVCCLLTFSYASANSVYQMNETFMSGATFSGTVTFNSAFNNLTGVDGWLTGGSGSSIYGSQHLTWIFNQNINYAVLPGIGGNYLMNGTPNHYTNFVTMTWDYTQAPVLTLTPNIGPYPGNNTNFGLDPALGGTLLPVPEPATYAMMMAGLGLLGVVARRRKTS